MSPSWATLHVYVYRGHKPHRSGYRFMPDFNRETALRQAVGEARLAGMQDGTRIELSKDGQVFKFRVARVAGQIGVKVL